ncbi:MAG TPA: prevent-host-death protein [Candidatus Saccharimonadia bacterium]|nr:prevent-host-death protein [Candidatus Saccharimonadia bacterium]
MPTIVPISDLRNYTEVLNQVDVGKPVYLTRNGRGRYVISKIDDYDPEITAEQLLAEIKKGEESLRVEPAISIDEVAKKFNIKL